MSEYNIDIADMQCWVFPDGSIQVENVSQRLRRAV